MKGETMRKAKGTPTGTNIFAMAELLSAAGTIPNRVEQVDAPHIRRCFRAGLLEHTGSELRITAAGIDALRSQVAKYPNASKPERQALERMGVTA